MTAPQVTPAPVRWSYSTVAACAAVDAQVPSHSNASPASPIRGCRIAYNDDVSSNSKRKGASGDTPPKGCGSPVNKASCKGAREAIRVQPGRVHLLNFNPLADAQSNMVKNKASPTATPTPAPGRSMNPSAKASSKTKSLKKSPLHRSQRK